MAKRKRKAPKRKRKAPKRRRRNRFGFINKKVNEILGAIAEPVGDILATKEFSNDTIKTTLETKLAGNAKKDTIIQNVVELKNTLKEDFKGYGTASDKLGKTIAFFKKKLNEGAEALYAMMDNMGLKEKIQEKIKEQLKNYKMISYAMLQKGFAGAYKLLPKGPVKLIGNIAGDAINEKSVNGEGYRKQEGDDKLYEIISLAQETAVQGGKAALEAAKKAAEEAKKKKAAEEAKKAAEDKKPAESAPPAPEAKKTETKPATTATTETTTKTSFGKRKRGPSASLKRMCKKHGVRLTVKRGKKRVYKSSKVLKEQCQRKLKKNKKKNFGKKKIKRSGIMPPRKTKGKKRRGGGARRIASILKASARRQAKRAGRGVSAAARYARRNPGRTAGYAAAGLAGLGALGLGGLEAKRARGRYLLDKTNPYFSRTRRRGGEERLQSIDHLQGYQDYQARRKALESPTGRFFRGLKNYPYRDTAREAFEGAKNYDYRGAPGRAYSGFMGLFKRKPAQAAQYGKRRRRRKKKKFGGSCPSHSYGKKASKKPSAATRRMCKKLKVRLTVKRGGKRVYKSEAMLKKQCKKAMKRKSKK
jgi:hypothetical protein